VALPPFKDSPHQFVYPVRDVSRKEGSDFTSCACAICKSVRVRVGAGNYFGNFLIFYKKYLTRFLIYDTISA
jgi:hypothetical protein